MRYGDDDRESDNIEDRRGESFGGGGGLRIGGGIGTVVLVLVALYFGVDPSVFLGGGSPAPVQHPPRPAQTTRSHDDEARFVGRVLADTESVWNAQLPAQTGRAYVEPKLVLFSGATQTACGVGQAAMGPFYCPPDQKVYIDLSFYDDLRQRFHAPGDFAQAYVVAHEIGHHLQNLLGISGRVHAARERMSEADGNRLSVRLELQADCLAGVWARHAEQTKHRLEPGDVEEALTAAAAIGDDRLQRQARGTVVPDSFTHGSSQQRVRWFRAGLDSGRVEACDTFGARSL